MRRVMAMTAVVVVAFGLFVPPRPPQTRQTWNT